MENQQTQKPERVRTILDDSKLKITARSPGGKRPASLVWAIYENNPRLVVYTGLDSDNKAENYQQLPMDITVAQSFFEMLETFAKSNDTQAAFVTRKPGEKGQGYAGEEVETGRAVIKRNQQGIITLAVVIPNTETRIVFEFRNRNWAALDNDNNPQTSAFLSTMACIGWIKATREALMHHLVSDWKFIERKPFSPNGGNRGGWNNNRGGGGGQRGGYNNGGSGGGGYGNNNGYSRGNQGSGNAGGNDAGSHDDIAY